ncbi:amidohydrolase family protein [Microbacterium album]|uniref:Amidohydrolase n=1 Tax=Microbacterium album TaxID=2053191 RepID=A0A917IAL0_9MICO|nr:amidohydrolase family protein [Microbacterium album]GGH33313.1 amidohydrolase [Microbacterium album]
MSVLAFTGGRVVTGAGEVHEPGTVIVQDGVIAAVGPSHEIEVPTGAEIVDATGRWVLPGFVDAHTHLGVHEDGEGSAGADGSELSDPDMSAVRAIDAVNIEDRAFRDALAGGVTTTVVKPGSGNPIGGTSVAIKTWGGRTVDDQVVKHPVSVKSALGENPKSTWGGRNQLPRTRMGIALVIRRALIGAQEYAGKRDAAAATGEPFTRDLGKEALAAALAGDLTWDQHVHRHDDIATALRLADEFGLRIVLNHGTEGHKLARELAERDIPVIFGPVLASRGKVESREASVSNLVALARAGVRVALCTDHPVVPIDALALQAAVALRAGLSWEQALAAISSAAAEIAGLDHRVGALVPGLDGDVVVWSGDPLHAASVAEAVFIEGREVFRREGEDVVIADRWADA